MFFKQYYLGCLSHASYLIGDEASGSAAVVDPQRDVEQYLQDAAAAGLRIRHVLLTHFHADFVAGHVELRDRVGAKIYLGRRGEAEYRFVPVVDGDHIELGEVILEILETPGHTPEGISIVVHASSASLGYADPGHRPEQAPYGVLTGDTLFIGDVGRPDLLASNGVSEVDLASMLYDSIHDKLLKLPDATRLYPAHGAGSMCGRNLGSETVSTIGEQREVNYALQPMSRGRFVRLVATGQPKAPNYFSYDSELNRKERQSLDTSLQTMLKPLPVAAFLSMQGDGAQVLDVRNATEFAAVHLRGALNIGLDGRFATWAGSLLDRDRPIILIGDPGSEVEAAVRLGRIGFDHVDGYLDQGMHALQERGDLLRTTERYLPTDLHTAMSAPNPPCVVDIRAASEREAGYIRGTLHLPLPDLVERAGELPRDRPIVLQCAGGYRSSSGACLLRDLGWSDVSDLVGGFRAWTASGLPIEAGVAEVGS